MRGTMGRRLARLEAAFAAGRMIVAKLPVDGDLARLLAANDIEVAPADLLVRIIRPNGVGDDFARVIRA